MFLVKTTVLQKHLRSNPPTTTNLNALCTQWSCTLTRMVWLSKRMLCSSQIVSSTVPEKCMLITRNSMIIWWRLSPTEFTSITGLMELQVSNICLTMDIHKNPLCVGHFKCCSNLINLAYHEVDYNNISASWAFSGNKYITQIKLGDLTTFHHLTTPV